MFPANAGMNRSGLGHRLDDIDVPRKRGDEPLPLALCGQGFNVPRKRGDEPLTM